MANGYREIEGMLGAIRSALETLPEAAQREALRGLEAIDYLQEIVQGIFGEKKVDHGYKQAIEVLELCDELLAAQSQSAELRTGDRTGGASEDRLSAILS